MPGNLSGTGAPDVPGRGRLITGAEPVSSVDLVDQGPERDVQARQDPRSV
jgi:hypothetical protein